MPRPLTAYFPPRAASGPPSRQKRPAAVETGGEEHLSVTAVASAQQPASPPPAWLVGGGSSAADTAPPVRAFAASSHKRAKPGGAAALRHPPPPSAHDASAGTAAVAPTGAARHVEPLADDKANAAGPGPSSSTAAGAGRKPTQQRPRRGPARQSHLDLGQAGFHAAPCPGCGMVYARGVAADERLHAQFHGAAVAAGGGGGGGGAPPAGVPGVRLPPGPRLPPGLALARAAPGGGAGRILHSPPPPPGGRRQRHPAVLAAVAAAEDALGSAPGWLLPDDPDSAPGGSAIPVHVFIAEGAGRRVVGVAVVEALAAARHRLSWWEGHGGRAAAGGPAPSPPPPPPTPRTHPLGVRGVWVDPGARRAGTAAALLDAARCGGVLPYTAVPRAAVAFSQPTVAGAGLAGAYAGGGVGGRFAMYE